MPERLVRGWARDDLLPHLRVGAKGFRGRILIEPAELDNLLASFKVGAATVAPAPDRSPKTEPLRHLG